MIKFAILNYQFAPMLQKVEQLELDFPEWDKVDPNVSFENKQQIFGQIFDDDFSGVRPVKIEGSRRHYRHDHLMKPTDGIIVLRISNMRTTKIYNADFTSKDYEDYPYCLVVFDNRPGIQRMLLEVKAAAFSDPNTLIRAMQQSLNKILKHYKLEISLDPIFRMQDFKDTVNRFEEGFREVSFCLPHKNLDRVMEEMDLSLYSIRQNWKTQMKLTFTAPKGGRVPIDLEDEGQMELVKLASGIGGATINMIPTGKSRPHIHCGEGHFVIESMENRIFDGLAKDDPNKSMFEEDSPLNQLKLAMKAIKNHYD